QGADIFALTSHSESFAIAGLEAIAAGNLVILTPGVPLAPLLESLGLGWVPRLDVGSIAQTLPRALASVPIEGESAARKRRAQPLVAENFTWDVISVRLLAVYRAILDRVPLPSFGLSEIRAPVIASLKPPFRQA